MKGNKILLITIAVVAILTVPLAFGLSSVQIGGNFVGFEEHIAAGVEIDADPKFTLVTTTENGYPTVSVQSGGSNNLLNGGASSAEFELEIPSGVSFIVLGIVKRELTGPAADLKIDISINDVNFIAEVRLGAFSYESKFYYTASGLAEGNTTLRTIPMGTQLNNEDFMRCDEQPAVLNVNAGRDIGLILRPTIEFKIILM